MIVAEKSNSPRGSSPPATTQTVDRCPRSASSSPSSPVRMCTQAAGGSIFSVQIGLRGASPTLATNCGVTAAILLVPGACLGSRWCLCTGISTRTLRSEWLGDLAWRMRSLGKLLLGSLSAEVWARRLTSQPNDVAVSSWRRQAAVGPPPFHGELCPWNPLWKS